MVYCGTTNEPSPGLPSPGPFRAPGLMSPTLWAWASSNYKVKVRNHLCYGKSTLLVRRWQFLCSFPPTRVTLRKFEQMNVVGKKDEKPFWCCHLAFLEDCLCWALILFRWSAWEFSLEYDSKDVLINFVGNLGKLFPTNLKIKKLIRHTRIRIGLQLKIWSGRFTK